MSLRKVSSDSNKNSLYLRPSPDFTASTASTIPSYIISSSNSGLNYIGNLIVGNTLDGLIRYL